ncbi:MAG: DUF1549 domain-containing protein, partial [Pirellulaceae bacterium]
MNSHHNHRSTNRVLALAMVIAAATAAAAPAQEPARNLSNERFFTEKIEPLLKLHCFECHSHAAREMEGGLTLDSRSGWSEGGDRGTAIVPGKPSDSLIIKAVRRLDEDLKMPPDEPLPDGEIKLLVEWVRRGAPDPRTTNPMPVEERDPTDWWSLRRLRRPDVPELATQVDDGVNEIDAFVHRQLQLNGLSPAPRAGRRTLIRRLYYDLHGLPPTPAEVTEFQVNSDPMAYEKLVDRLLNSPQYGERWARH